MHPIDLHHLSDDYSNGSVDYNHDENIVPHGRTIDTSLSSNRIPGKEIFKQRTHPSTAGLSSTANPTMNIDNKRISAAFAAAAANATTPIFLLPGNQILHEVSIGSRTKVVAVQNMPYLQHPHPPCTEQPKVTKHRIVIIGSTHDSGLCLPGGGLFPLCISSAETTATTSIAKAVAIEAPSTDATEAPCSTLRQSIMGSSVASPLAPPSPVTATITAASVFVSSNLPKDDNHPDAFVPLAREPDTTLRPSLEPGFRTAKDPAPLSPEQEQEPSTTTTTTTTTATAPTTGRGISNNSYTDTIRNTDSKCPSHPTTFSFIQARPFATLPASASPLSPASVTSPLLTSPPQAEEPTSAALQCCLSSSCPDQKESCSGSILSSSSTVNPSSSSSSCSFVASVYVTTTGAARTTTSTRSLKRSRSWAHLIGRYTCSPIINKNKDYFFSAATNSFSLNQSSVRNLASSSLSLSGSATLDGNHYQQHRSKRRGHKLQRSLSGGKFLARMMKLTRNHSMPVPTNSKKNGPSRSHRNTFSLPSMSLSRTSSDKSGNGRSGNNVSDSTTIASMSPIIMAIHRGNFLMLSDFNLDLLIRALAGKNSSALETINIKSAAISGTDAKLLARLVRSSDAANIKVLKLDRNAISQDAFKHLFEAWKYNRTITTLSMARSGVNDKTIKYIAKAMAKNDTLKELDLSSNRITGQGIETLCETLLYNRTLVRLCLQSNNIKKTGAPHLATLLTKNNVIRHLNVGSNGLGSEGCIMIADAVRFNRTLTSLSMDMNEMGPQGAAAMAVALVSNRHLTYLYIPDNNIGDAGLLEICESLKRNNCLIGLDLELNHIGHAQSVTGMKALAEVLKINTSLREINLSYNLFSGEAIQELMEGVPANSTLESILFTNCCIPTEGAMAIAQVLSTATSLQNLGLTSNPDIAVEGYWALATSLAKNRSMKGIQLDYNSEDRHVLYESIQHSLTRNFIWQQALYSAACRVLTLSRIVLHGRPAKQKLLLSQQLQQRTGAGGAWNLLRRVALGRTHSANSLTSLLTLRKSRSSVGGDASSALSRAPFNGADGGDDPDEGYDALQNLAHGNNSSCPPSFAGSSIQSGFGSNSGSQMIRQGSGSSSNASVQQQQFGNWLYLPNYPLHPIDQDLLLGQSQSQLQPQPQSGSQSSSLPTNAVLDYNAHKVMANLGNMPYEIFETICAYLDPAHNMSMTQIRASIQAGGDRSTLSAYYTKASMLERIFHSRYISPVGMRYSIKNGEERI